MSQALFWNDEKPNRPSSDELSLSLLEYLALTGGVPLSDPEMIKARQQKIHEIEGDDSCF